jgi:hypothetical protein
VNANTFMSYAEVCTEHAEHLLPAASVTTVFMQVSICSSQDGLLTSLITIIVMSFYKMDIARHIPVLQQKVSRLTNISTSDLFAYSG